MQNYNINKDNTQNPQTSGVVMAGDSPSYSYTPTDLGPMAGYYYALMVTISTITTLQVLTMDQLNLSEAVSQSQLAHNSAWMAIMQGDYSQMQSLVNQLNNGGNAQSLEAQISVLTAQFNQHNTEYNADSTAFQQEIQGMTGAASTGQQMQPEQAQFAQALLAIQTKLVQVV